MSGAAVLLLVPLLAASALGAEPEGRGSTVFFGLNLGSGVAWIDHPNLTPDARVGLEYDVAFGLGLSRALAVGIELGTWQPPNVDGNPAHLHMFAPRIEYTLGEADGLVLASALGVGLGDGSATKRFGVGATAELGWRFPVGIWTAMTADAGVRGFVYGDGMALAPFLGLQIRFYGRSGF